MNDAFTHPLSLKGTALEHPSGLRVREGIMQKVR